MPDVPIGHPYLGIDEDNAFSEQPPATTRDAQNVRAIQPKTGRRRTAQRSGLSLHATQIDATGKIDAIATVTLDNKNVTYASAGSTVLAGDAEWTYETPNKKSAFGAVVDRSGNVYVIEGNNSIVKVSAAGKELAVIPLPVEDESHVVRALAVDELGWVYAGVSEVERTVKDAQEGKLSGKADEALLFGFAPFLDEKYEMMWKVSPGGFISDIKVRDGRLYALVNKPQTHRCSLVSYLAIRSASPLKDTENPSLPYLSMAMAVNSSGDIYVTAPPFAERATNPQNPDLAKSVVAWTPSDLKPGTVLSDTTGLPVGADIEPVVWAHYDATDASTLVTLGGESADVEDGDEVITWEDKSGNGRNLTHAPDAGYFVTGEPEQRPLYASQGMAAGGEIVTERGKWRALRSGPGPSQSLAHRKMGTRTIPGYYNPALGSGVAETTGSTDPASAGYAMLAVIRPVGNAEDGISGNAPAPIFCWGLDHTSGGKPDPKLITLAIDRLQTFNQANFYGGTSKFGEGRMSLIFGNNAASTDSSTALDKIEGGFERVGTSTPLAGHLNSWDYKNSYQYVPLVSAPHGLGAGLFTLTVMPQLVAAGGTPMGSSVWWNGELKGHFFLATHKAKEADGGFGLGTDHGIGPYSSYYGYASCGYSEIIVFDRRRPQDAGDALEQAVTTDYDVPLTAPSFPEYYDAALPAPTVKRVARIELTTTNNIAQTGDSLGAHAVTFHSLGGLTEASAFTGTVTVEPTDDTDLAGKSTQGFLVHSAVTSQGAYTGDVSSSTVLKVQALDDEGWTNLAVPGSGGAAGAKTYYLTINWDWDGRNPTQQEKVEGYLAHKHGIAAALPSASVAYEMPNKWGGNYKILRAHPYKDDPPTTETTEHNKTMATSASGMLAKVSAGSLAVDWLQEDAGGLGYGVAVDSTDGVYTVGPDGDNADSLEIKRYTDAGDSVTEAATHTVSPAMVSQNVYIRLAVDNFDNLYVPLAADNAGPSLSGGQTTQDAMVRVYKPDLSQIALFQEAEADKNQRAYAVALPIKWEDGSLVATNPDYEDDLTKTTTPVARSEFMYVAAGKNGDDHATAPTDMQRELMKMKLVTSTPNGAAARTVYNVAVANGFLKGFNATQVWAVQDEDGNEQKLSVTASTGKRFVDHATLYEEIVFCDGGPFYLAYKPSLDKTTGSAQDASQILEADKGGSMPTGARLAAAWRGRLVFARFQDSPQDWAMSAEGDIRDWRDFLPGLPPTQSIRGANVEGPGIVPDVINALIPYDDDLLFFLCDHSVYRMTGNPLDGGQIDLVSNVTGGAFGRSWCRDPEGRIWFFGSRGGLYVMAPGGAIERISQRKVERSLQGVDLSTYNVELAYNWEDEGVHIFLFPHNDDQAAADHWFFDIKNGGFWKDAFTNPPKSDPAGAAVATSQPTAVLVLDGDAVGDRIMILGTNDGYLKKWNRDAVSDAAIGTNQANAPIDSYVTFGPYIGDANRELRTTRGELLLAEDLDGAVLEVFATNTPDELGSSVKTRLLGTGRNHLPLRSRAKYVYLRIRNGAVAQAWALEDGSLTAQVVGKVRRRQSHG